jgi:hypothetical protein
MVRRVRESRAWKWHIPTIHILHAQNNVPCIILKCSIECNDIRGTAVVAHLQLSKDLLTDIFLRVYSNDLWDTGELEREGRNRIVRTFLAMTTLVPACMTLLTVPPLPAPSSLSTTKSSLLRSSLNSSPISRVSVLLLSVFPIAPGICESPSEGFDPLRGGALKARPFTFLRFSVLASNTFDMAAGSSCRKKSLSVSMCCVERGGSSWSSTLERDEGAERGELRRSAAL